MIISQSLIDGLVVAHSIFSYIVVSLTFLRSTSQLSLDKIKFYSSLMCHLKLLFQGRFEILTLSGSFMPTENGGTKSRSGGMSVSLAGPDGRVVGGGLAGLLIAAGPVQVI